jgi:cation diffusion facilitator CzcD-associated flavoprotein CzcO
VSSTVAIIGAGFGGVGLAVRLKQAGIDFVLFEKGAGVGGVWRENTYPGAACDVPSHLYSFSFEPKPDWPRKYAEQPHILGYLEHCAKKYDLLKHARFNTEIESARFDETNGLWTLRAKTGEEFQARALVTACGQLNRPATPSLKGLESFRGEKFHSALWNHGIDFAGKRVAIVGTGASAIQFVPTVVAKAAKVTLFQRSPPWIMPKPDRVFRDFEKALMRSVPGVIALYRLATYLKCEARLIGFRKDTWMNAFGVRMAMRHLRRQIPNERLRRQLTQVNDPEQW